MSDEYELRVDMDRVLLRSKAELDLSPWEAVLLAKELLDAAECAQSESEKPAAWSSSLFPASEIEVGDFVGGYEVARYEEDDNGRLTVVLVHSGTKRMTVYFEKDANVPLEKSR